MFKTSFKYKILILSASFLYLFKAAAFSAGVSLIRPLSFGNIIAGPFGEIIEINAKTGPAVPVVFTAGNSQIDGGFSGIIRVSSDIPGQMINVVYPVSIVLQAAGAADMVLDGIDARSKIFATSTAVEEIDFDVGGLLHINSGQKSQNYTATLIVTVDIINP